MIMYWSVGCAYVNKVIQKLWSAAPVSVLIGHVKSNCYSDPAFITDSNRVDMYDVYNGVYYLGIVIVIHVLTKCKSTKLTFNTVLNCLVQHMI